MKPYSGRSQLRYYAVEVLCRPVVADSDHLDENLDPHQKERRGYGSATNYVDPDPSSSQKDI
jgi:hypothetical protein